MQRIDTMAHAAIRAALEAQPASSGKVQFAWTLAAGPALARATSITWENGRLHAIAKSERWRIEVERARPLILTRLAALLGSGIVQRLEITTHDRAR